MKKVTKFDKPTLKALRVEMQNVLDKFGANLEFEIGNIKFVSAEADIKIKAKVKGAETVTQSLLKQMVEMEGLSMKNVQGDELVDFAPRNYKMPYVYKCGQTGKLYKAELKAMQRRFGPMMAA